MINALVLFASLAPLGDGNETKAIQLKTEVEEYRRCLDRFRVQCGSVRKLPAADFFLFGMGNRPKLLYRKGTLTDLRTGRVLRKWKCEADWIVPHRHEVGIRPTANAPVVTIREDANGIVIDADANREIVAASPLHLPEIQEHPHGPVLRVLHQEILINIVDGKPVPNLMVYGKPWYRDAAMMCMVLEKTGNLHLVRDWILKLRDPFDRNNKEEEEPDNLGQLLYMIALVSDRDHPAVEQVRSALSRFEKGGHIEGRTDFALHPVYQTHWVKYGLSSLGLNDRYRVPTVDDANATLFWWSPGGVRGKTIQSDDYPYLTWAGNHSAKGGYGPIGDQDYPLTWEAKASQADYAGMDVISPAYREQALCVPHTWHSAEAFLYLWELGQRPAPGGTDDSR